jgi:long-chain acyl-CoA synthetase
MLYVCVFMDFVCRAIKTYFSYLPYAHSMEKVLIACCVLNGVKIGLFHGEIQKCVDDVKILKPHMFVSVPRIYNRIYDGIMMRVKGMKGFKAKMINRALRIKLENIRKGKGFKHGIYDRLVFKKFKPM